MRVQGRAAVPGQRADLAAEAIARNTRAIARLESARKLPSRERRQVQQEVVLDYVDVARAVANRYRTRSQDYRDLCQVAYIGLTKAVHRFEAARGQDIVSFAVPTISGEIKRYLRDSGWVVRPPRRLQELSAEVGAETAELEQRLGREPTVGEIAEETGRSAELVAEARSCARGKQPLSLDAPMGGTAGEASAPFAESLAAPDPDFERVELGVSITEACRALSPYERGILYLRFFEGRTQAEIADEYEVSQMQVSRLLRRILAKMRERLESGAGQE